MARGQLEELAFVEIWDNPITRLVEVRDSLRITPSFMAFGYIDFDLGSPGTREQVQNLTDTDGTDDQTAYHGNRPVSLALKIRDDAFAGLDISTWDTSKAWNSSAFWVSFISAWLYPGRRFRVYFKFKGQDRRWIDVRPASFGAPVVMEHPGSRDLVISLVSPSGRIKSFSNESPDWRHYRRTTFDDTGGTGTAGGVAWNTGIVWGSGIAWGVQPADASDFVYQGNVPARPVIRMHAGSAATLENPRITVTGPDGVARSKGFIKSIPMGSFVVVDSVQGISYENTPAASIEKYGANPIAGVRDEYPLISPGYSGSGANGLNQVEMTALTAGAGAFYEVLWYDEFYA